MDAMQVVDLLDAHMDRLHGMRSVLWVRGLAGSRRG